MCDVTAFPKKCSAQELLYEVAAKEKNTESRDQKKAQTLFLFYRKSNACLFGGMNQLQGMI